MRRAMGHDTQQQTKPCDRVDSKSNRCAKRRETGSHLQIVEPEMFAGGRRGK